jgi:NitT/TauT family transport system substrate-binding protein
MTVNRARRLRVGGVAAAAATVLLAAACGSGTSSSGASAKKDLTPVNFQLNFTAGGFNAGFSLAKQNGYYADAGLDVNIIKGNGSATTAQLVASGQAQLAYADAVPVMQLIAKGAPIKVVSTLYQANPNQVTSLKEQNITSVADLKGHSIGVPAGSSQAPLLPILFEANGISAKDVKLVNLPITSMVPTLLQKKVDAILGSLDFYGVQLKKRNVETNDLLFADNGVPTVSTSIIARTDYLEKNGDLVKKFIAASIKGWDEALKNPDAAIAALKKTFPDVKEEQAKDELTATAPLFCKNGAKSIGKAEPEAWAESQKILAQIGSVPEGVDPTKYYTYDYLPATLPSC